MKSVLLSIQPKWWDFIINPYRRPKTIEIRKSYPKELNTPFKCYVYCTKAKREYGSGQVVGEFICDKIESFVSLENGRYAVTHDELRDSCLTQEELWEYGKGKPLYGWYIGTLIIYGKPKDLSEFGLKRPPQSWAYVEELQ